MFELPTPGMPRLLSWRSIVPIVYIYEIFLYLLVLLLAVLLVLLVLQASSQVNNLIELNLSYLIYLFFFCAHPFGHLQ